LNQLNSFKDSTIIRQKDVVVSQDWVVLSKFHQAHLLTQWQVFKIKILKMKKVMRKAKF